MSLVTYLETEQTRAAVRVVLAEIFGLISEKFGRVFFKFLSLQVKIGINPSSSIHKKTDSKNIQMINIHPWHYQEPSCSGF